MYELMVVGNPKVDSEMVLSLVDRALKEVSATSVSVDRLGRKLLAYPVAKQTEGEYIVFNFEVDPESVAKISDKLHLAQEEILRYLITRVKEKKSRGDPLRPSPKANLASSGRSEASKETKVTKVAPLVQKPEKTEGKEKKAKAKVEIRAKPQAKSRG